MPANIAELNERCGIRDVVRFEPGPGGLTQIAVRAAGGEAAIALHGAHVLSYRLAGSKPVLWLSRHSWFEPGKPIRGGVPICFPWFGPQAGDADAPPHGFARLLEWQVERVSRRDDGSAEIVLLLASDERTARWWPMDFELRHRVRVGPCLTMALELRNRDSRPMPVELALHSYFTVGNIPSVRVYGLTGVEYLDKVDSGRRKRDPEPAIRFTGETDRVYLDTTNTCVLDDPPLRRRITVDKLGSRSTVVWNPWAAKAARMSDFGDDEWPGMVCIETANVADNALTLAPGAEHVMETAISVDS